MPTGSARRALRRHAAVGLRDLHARPLCDAGHARPAMRSRGGGNSAPSSSRRARTPSPLCRRCAVWRGLRACARRAIRAQRGLVLGPVAGASVAAGRRARSPACDIREARLGWAGILVHCGRHGTRRRDEAERRAGTAEARVVRRPRWHEGRSGQWAGLALPITHKSRWTSRRTITHRRERGERRDHSGSRFTSLRSPSLRSLTLKLMSRPRWQPDSFR